MSFEDHEWIDIKDKLPEGGQAIYAEYEYMGKIETGPAVALQGNPKAYMVDFYTGSGYGDILRWKPRTIVKPVEKKKTILDMVKDKKVIFIFYKNNELWYKTECGFEFPVPIEDTGNAVFNHEEKAMLLMRYIRKHMEMLEKAKEEKF